MAKEDSDMETRRFGSSVLLHEEPWVWAPAKKKFRSKLVAYAGFVAVATIAVAMVV